MLELMEPDDKTDAGIATQHRSEHSQKAENENESYMRPSGA